MTAITSDTLNAYVDGTLPAADRATIDVELEQNPALLDELRELQATALLLSNLPEYTPRRSFILPAEFARPTPINASVASGGLKLLPFIRAFSVAAALMFMVVAGSLFFDINGQSVGDPGQTFQQQAVILGETGHPSEASEHAEDESPAEGGSGELVQRGDTASAADEPMDDLAAIAPQPESAVENSPGAAPSLPFGATEQGEADHSNWVFVSIVLGAASVALGLAWLAIANTARQRQP